jgi:hypothetical protein
MQAFECVITAASDKIDAEYMTLIEVRVSSQTPLGSYLERVNR